MNFFPQQPLVISGPIPNPPVLVYWHAVSLYQAPLLLQQQPVYITALPPAPQPVWGSPLNRQSFPFRIIFNRPSSVVCLDTWTSQAVGAPRIINDISHLSRDRGIGVARDITMYVTASGGPSITVNPSTGTVAIPQNPMRRVVLNDKVPLSEMNAAFDDVAMFGHRLVYVVSYEDLGENRITDADGRAAITDGQTGDGQGDQVGDDGPGDTANDEN
ncbi:hypothetical protein B0I35DRAFT_411870 [Stachybotrys elegans]|uniref:Uncharacterized protein n=1 Tax=Stachybotrys elegans TaxID=80388 RepID=A0A8K0SJC5_9HYPO|nr:hypothetical protein B0I35DRAFT_411870 [Stachybotrys elegans]